MKLTEENLILYSYKDISFESGCMYKPAVYVDCGEEFDNVDLKKQILENQHIVERLKKRIKEVNEEINKLKIYEHDPCIDSLSDELDEILGSQDNGDGGTE